MAHTTVTIKDSDENSFHAMLNMLRGRNFRLLWISEAISLLGDQFTLIALPWLVLQLTGDALAMGVVLALAGIPRALFMLVGGALTDRFSPRALMLGSNIFRMVFLAVLAPLVLTGRIELWMLYIFALAFGLADAFFFPAQGAIVPQLVAKDRLQTGNAIIQGTMRLSVFAGPLLAGVLIALLAGNSTQIAGTAEAVPDLRGLGISFGFDALTFLVSAILLLMMNFRKPNNGTDDAREEGNVLSSIWEGLLNVWNDAPLRVYFVIVSAIHLFATGPVFVGIPVLADTRFPEGAAAFGIIMSAFGGGNLLGIILAGVLPKPAPQRMGSVLLGVISTVGVGLMLLGFVSSTAVAALVTLVMGVAEGYIQIMFVTWLQRRTPQAMLGRMMSLLTFSAVGLIPISTALSGALVGMSSPSALFWGAGILLLAVVLVSAHNPATRSMEMKQQLESPAPAKAMRWGH